MDTNRIAPHSPASARIAAETATRDAAERSRLAVEEYYEHARALADRAPVDRLLAGLVAACAATVAEAACLAEHGARWRALYASPWARYEACLAVPALRPLLRLAREALGAEAPASDEAYRRDWWEASRWRGGGVAPEDRRDRWACVGHGGGR